MYSKVSETHGHNWHVTSLQEIKEQLNIIDFTDDDAYLERLVHVAEEIAMMQLGGRRLHAVQVVTECHTDELPDFLPYSPVITIDSVTVDGVAITDYTFSIYSGIISLPDTYTGTVLITYTCGYSNPSDVPESIKQGILILIADLYANRESESAVNTKRVHLAAERIFGAYRRVAV